MEEENLSPGCKNLPPNHQSKISTMQDSCNTLGLYESSKLQLATNFSESFLFLSYRRTSIEAPMETPPMKIGFSDVASHISLAILSLAGMCLWLRNVFTKSQSMEWKRWKREVGTWFFSKGKSSFFSYKWLASLSQPP